MTKKNILAGLIILVVGSLLMSACSGQQGTPETPTVDANLIYTQAAETVQASVAQTNAAKPPEPTATETLAPAPTNTMDPNMAAGMTATANAVLQPGNNPTATVVAGTGATATAQPPVTSLPTATSAVVAKPPTSTGDKAELVGQDPADGSSVGKGDIVTTTLVIQNVGTTTWTTAYKLVYYAGDRMSSPYDLNMPHQVKPGESAKLVFQLKAPDSSGKKQIIWVMQNPDAANFYSLYLELNVK